MFKPWFPSDLGANEHQIDLGLVVGPRSKLHGAILVVKGEIRDVHGAGGLEYGWGEPGDGAVILQQGLRLVIHQKVTYGTWRKHLNATSLKAQNNICLKMSPEYEQKSMTLDCINTENTEIFLLSPKCSSCTHAP